MDFLSKLSIKFIKSSAVSKKFLFNLVNLTIRKHIPPFALIFLICLIWCLWIFASGNVSLAVLPAMISFMATLSNNFNGVYIWSVLYKNTHRNGGVYLAMRPVNIKGVTKLKRTYRKMVSNETEKYVSPSAQPKKQKAKKNKSISEIIDSGH